MGMMGYDEKYTSRDSHSSHQQRPIVPPRGDYQTLLSCQKAEVVYDITFRFAQKFLSKGDRTVDQMIQSARSGKQNIPEVSQAATTSKETEIKLTHVDHASLEELLADYRDYLRVRDHQLWDKDSREARYVCDPGRRGRLCIFIVFCKLSELSQRQYPAAGNFILPVFFLFFINGQDGNRTRTTR